MRNPARTSNVVLQVLSQPRKKCIASKILHTAARAGAFSAGSQAGNGALPVKIESTMTFIGQGKYKAAATANSDNISPRPASRRCAIINGHTDRQILFDSTMGFAG